MNSGGNGRVEELYEGKENVEESYEGKRNGGGGLQCKSRGRTCIGGGRHSMGVMGMRGKEVV